MHTLCVFLAPSRPLSPHAPESAWGPGAVWARERMGPRRRMGPRAYAAPAARALRRRQRRAWLGVIAGSRLHFQVVEHAGARGLEAHLLGGG